MPQNTHLFAHLPAALFHDQHQLWVRAPMILKDYKGPELELHLCTTSSADDCQMPTRASASRQVRMGASLSETRCCSTRSADNGRRPSRLRLHITSRPAWSRARLRRADVGASAAPCSRGAPTWRPSQQSTSCDSRQLHEWQYGGSTAVQIKEAPSHLFYGKSLAVASLYMSFWGTSSASMQSSRGLYKNCPGLDAGPFADEPSSGVPSSAHPVHPGKWVE